MNRFPSIELIEANHDFPGLYTFKAIGDAREDFAGRVLAAAKQATSPGIEPKVSVREADGGRHAAVTLEIQVASAIQVHAIYESLMKVAGLLVLL